jgi:superfamily II DNA helicase RecQ
VLINEDTHGMTYEEDEEMEEVEVQCDVPFHQLERGEFNIIYAHPETFSRKKFGSLLRCNTYQGNVCAVVIDEVHMVSEWFIL